MTIPSWNFVRVPKAKSHALGTRTKFQLEIRHANVIFGIVYFREIILESSWNVSETTPSTHNNIESFVTLLMAYIYGSY